MLPHISDVIVSKDEAARRHVKQGDYVACALAFIDCKKPGSHLKQNFSVIGAGVTQSAEQVVNIAEPHGFQIGAAGMPGGITNNLHIHYTAEVFMIYNGSWVFRWGDQGKDGEIAGGPGDMVSMPTWIFRGFSNTGTSKEPELIFTALGGDDTGGIIWHPEIVREAGTFGLYLTKDNMMVDTTKGEKKPADKDLMPLISDTDRAKLRKWTVDEMRGRVVTKAERKWSKQPLLCSVIKGHAVELAPAIGFGMTEDRNAAPKVTNPHGFTVEWLKILPGQTLGRHRMAPKQVWMIFAGSAELTLNEKAHAVTSTMLERETISVPSGVWRSVTNKGTTDCEIAVMTSGDGKAWIDWAPEVRRAARAAGFALDHNGSVAPLHLLPMAVQAAE